MIQRLQRSARLRVVTALSYCWLLFVVALVLWCQWDEPDFLEADRWTQAVTVIGYLLYVFHVGCVCVSMIVFCSLLLCRRKDRFDGYGKALLASGYPLLLLLFSCGERTWYFFAAPILVWFS